MKYSSNTKRGSPPARRNPVVRELVQKPRRNAGRHQGTKTLALERARRLDNAKSLWYN